MGFSRSRMRATFLSLKRRRFCSCCSCWSSIFVVGCFGRFCWGFEKRKRGGCYWRRKFGVGKEFFSMKKTPEEESKREEEPDQLFNFNSKSLFSLRKNGKSLLKKEDHLLLFW